MVNLLDPSAVITRMHDAKRYAEMHDYCRGLLAKDPADMLALQNISLSLIHLERYDEAVAYCDRVLAARASDTYALKNKIFALESLGRHGDVLPLCRDILSSDPKDIWALNSMGLSLNELNRHGEAIKYYDTSLLIDPGDLTALMNKAISLSHLGDYRGAIEYYDRAQRAGPDQNGLLSGAKSRLFERLGMHDEAFLAAQGVLNADMAKFQRDAQANKCSVFHQFCNDEFQRSERSQHRPLGR